MNLERDMETDGPADQPNTALPSGLEMTSYNNQKLPGLLTGG